MEKSRVRQLMRKSRLSQKAVYAIIDGKPQSSKHSGDVPACDGRVSKYPQY